MSKTNEAPRAALAAKPISPLMQDYVAWLKAETGYDVDPLSVQLSGVLRSAFQKSEGNQRRLAESIIAKEADTAARAERKAARAQAAQHKAEQAKQAAEAKGEEPTAIPTEEPTTKPLARRRAAAVIPAAEVASA